MTVRAHIGEFPRGVASLMDEYQRMPCPLSLHTIPPEDCAVHQPGCPCIETGEHSLHRCEHGAEWRYE